MLVYINFKNLSFFSGFFAAIFLIFMSVYSLTCQNWEELCCCSWREPACSCTTKGYCPASCSAGVTTTTTTTNTQPVVTTTIADTTTTITLENFTKCTVSNCCRGECPAGQRCYNGNCVDPDENTADAQWVCENCQSVDCEVTSGPVCGIDGSTRCHKLSRPNLGFEYSTTPFCCNAYFGQEYVTWRRTETRDPSYQPPFPEDPNDIMCCNELRDCAYNGVCYPIDYAIDSTYDGRIDSICASPKVWADCDAAEVVWNKCGYPGEQWNVGRGNANADGGFSLTKGCGDDPGEYYKYRDCSWDWPGICVDDKNDDACCNSENNCVWSGTCYSNDQYICSSYVRMRCLNGVWRFEDCTENPTNCGYGECNDNQKPSWTCSGSPPSAICSYSCINDETCVTATTTTTSTTTTLPNCGNTCSSLGYNDATCGTCPAAGTCVSNLCRYNPISSRGNGPWSDCGSTNCCCFMSETCNCATQTCDASIECDSPVTTSTTSTTTTVSGGPTQCPNGDEDCECWEDCRSGFCFDLRTEAIGCNYYDGCSDGSCATSELCFPRDEAIIQACKADTQRYCHVLVTCPIG